MVQVDASTAAIRASTWLTEVIAVSPTELSLARRVDTACDRFEEAWQAGEKPRIEYFLRDSTGNERACLLRALLSVEVELRLAAGESVLSGQYQSRFPDDFAAIAFALAEPSRARSAE
jgi:serine/threonine-protein kinase